jgi:hypothetical protein
VDDKLFESPVWPHFRKILDKFPTIPVFRAERLANSNFRRDERLRKARDGMQAVEKERKPMAHQMVKEKEKRQEEDSVLFVEGYEIAMAIAEAKCRSRRRKRTIIKLGWRLLQTAQIVSNNASETNKIVCVRSNRLRPFSTVLKADAPPLYAPTDLVEIAPCVEMKHSMPPIKCLASPGVAVVPAHRMTSIRFLLVFRLHQYENLIKKRHGAMRAARWSSFEDDETSSKYIPFPFVLH